MLDGIVVRDDDDRAAIVAIHLLDEREDLFGGVVVERAGGLVAQQQPGIFHERAPDGAALLLPTRYLMGELLAMLPQAQRVQKRLHGQGVVGEVLADFDVLLHGQVAHQVVELEDEAQLAAAVFHKVAVSQAGKLGAIDADGPGIRRLQTAHQVEEGRLAAAGRAQQNANLALSDGGGDVAQHFEARFAFAVVLAQAFDF